MNENDYVLPTPHLAKLRALLQNPRLPEADKPRVEEAVMHYQDWIRELKSVTPRQANTVKKLVEATNVYKTFIELKLIFDSPEDFLYRQKGQLKLDNTIIEEFLPHLMIGSLRLPERGFEFGPQKSFAGLSFDSKLIEVGASGHAILRAKDQDFVLGKKIYIQTSFDRDFGDADSLEAHLGYVCAECKTNLDKTMFQEAVATSRDLKTAVPSALYFLVCEFLDMSPVPIAATHIDDVLIVRKAKRMSANERQQYKSAAQRENLRASFLEFLEASRFSTDVFQRMIDTIQVKIDEFSTSTDEVLERGYF